MPKRKNITVDFYSLFHVVCLIPAAMVSVYYNNSVLWAIFHMLVSPWYMIYDVLSRKLADGVWMEIVQYYF